MSEILAIEDRRELFVDHTLIERTEDAQLVLHRPEPQETAVLCDASWEGHAPGYPTVFQDGDRRRHSCGPVSSDPEAGITLRRSRVDDSSIPGTRGGW